MCRDQLLNRRDPIIEYQIRSAYQIKCDTIVPLRNAKASIEILNLGCRWPANAGVKFEYPVQRADVLFSVLRTVTMSIQVTQNISILTEILHCSLIPLHSPNHQPKAKTKMQG